MHFSKIDFTKYLCATKNLQFPRCVFETFVLWIYRIDKDYILDWFFVLCYRGHRHSLCVKSFFRTTRHWSNFFFVVTYQIYLNEVVLHERWKLTEVLLSLDITKIYVKSFSTTTHFAQPLSPWPPGTCYDGLSEEFSTFCDLSWSEFTQNDSPGPLNERF